MMMRIVRRTRTIRTRTIWTNSLTQATNIRKNKNRATSNNVGTKKICVETKMDERMNVLIMGAKSKGKLGSRVALAIRNDNSNNKTNKKYPVRRRKKSKIRHLRRSWRASYSSAVPAQNADAHNKIPTPRLSNDAIIHLQTSPLNKFISMHHTLIVVIFIFVDYTIH